MKKFTLTCTENNDGYIEMKMMNTGFNGMELIAIIETKKADLIEQMTHPEKFTCKREYAESDGSVVHKFKEGETEDERSCDKCAYQYGHSKCGIRDDKYACKTCVSKKNLGKCPCAGSRVGNVCENYEEETADEHL